MPDGEKKEVELPEEDFPRKVIRFGEDSEGDANTSYDVELLKGRDLVDVDMYDAAVYHFIGMTRQNPRNREVFVLLGETFLDLVEHELGQTYMMGIDKYRDPDEYNPFTDAESGNRIWDRKCSSLEVTRDLVLSTLDAFIDNEVSDSEIFELRDDVSKALDREFLGYDRFDLNR
jgi:hypothetical protein